METYEKLLDRAFISLPEQKQSSERFEIPKVRGHLQGNRTIISNFYQISDVIRRPSEHLLKFILKELATPGELKKTALIIGSKVSSTRLNEKIAAYAAIYVICQECGKPDTKIAKDKQLHFLVCQACGAKHIIKEKLK